MKCTIDLHYLPSLEYFTALLWFDHIQLERYEHYRKQSFRTRTHVLGANGVIRLHVPVTEKHGKPAIKDIRIDDRTRWRDNHWRTLVSAYRKAPYFEHYATGLEQALFRNHVFLFDLNMDLLSFCLQSLNAPIRFSATLSYRDALESGNRDLRSVISPKISYWERCFYRPAPYQQVFGSKFVPNLSFIDLLFCEGPGAIQVLRSSQAGDLNK